MALSRKVFKWPTY